MANKHVIHCKRTGLFVRIFGITIYFWLSLLSDSFNRKEENTKNFQESSGTGQSKERKGERLIKSVSSVIGGWARCAPSPTTRVAGHDVAAA